MLLEEASPCLTRDNGGCSPLKEFVADFTLENRFLNSFYEDGGVRDMRYPASEKA